MHQLRPRKSLSARLTFRRYATLLGYTILGSTLLTTSLPATAIAAPGYLREPAIAGSTVVFNAEQSVWSVSLAGGTAQRLTSAPTGAHAIDPHPVLSPDGSEIAFLANPDGPTEIYVMPRSGGTPRRITYENTRLRLIGWDAHAGILYTLPSIDGPYYSHNVAAIDPVSGHRRVFPIENANDVALSPDGRWLYAIRFGLAMTGDHMRAYRGGSLSQLWRFDLQTNREAERIGTQDANLRRPMLWRDRLIVISDLNGRDNLWSLALDGTDAKQITHFTDYSVAEASISGDHVILRKGADLFDIDLTSGQSRPVPVNLVSDNPARAPYWLAAPWRFLTDDSLAPKGDLMAFTARGHVIVAGPGPRRRVIIPTPDTIRLRQARVTPDGKFIIAFSDAAGDSALWRFPIDGSGPGTALNTASPTEPNALALSPDGKYAAHTDLLGKLWLLDLASRTEKLIDDAMHDGTNVFDTISWSPDGHVLTFVRTRGTNLRRQIALYTPATGKTVWVTDGKYDSFSPDFSPDGHWMWFLSDRNFALANDSPWGDRNLGPVFPRRTGIYALALQPGQRFPFAPATELDHPAKAPNDKKNDSQKKSLPAIVWDGLASRLYQVPVPAGNYQGLHAADEFLYVIDSPDGPGPLKSIHIDDNEHKIETFAPKVRDTALSADAKTLMVFAPGKQPDITLAPVGAKMPGELSGKKLDLSDLRLRIVPTQEWTDEFEDAWRLHRDHYFDRNLLGVDWKATRAHITPLLDRLGDRADLNDLLGQMVAEIGAMHSQIIPAQTLDEPAITLIAGLGARITHEPDGFRIAHIYQGDHDLPNRQSPLAKTGVDAQDGDLITAVNGQPTKGASDLSLLLADQAGHQVLLTLARDTKTHQIVVTPVNARAERDLRITDWETGRANAVEKAGGGRIGYVHLSAMGSEDMETFAREFYANIDRDGMIIDVRGNDGGNIDSWVLTALMRRPWMFWARYGNAPAVDMQQSFQGRIVVLADELTYSDGETFSQGVKSLHIAPLIGERTAGAGVWLSDGDRLIDLGNARTAENPYFDLNGNWLVENRGVSPDITVENMPVAAFHGVDQQLDAAIAFLMKDMAAHPRPKLVPKPLTPQVPAPR